MGRHPGVDVVDEERNPGPGGPPAADRRRAWALAAVLVVVPGALWTLVLAVPFLPLPAGWKVTLAAALAIGAEAVFWLAAFFLGREVVSRYRRYLDPRNWFRKGPPEG